MPRSCELIRQIGARSLWTAGSTLVQVESQLSTWSRLAMSTLSRTTPPRSFMLNISITCHHAMSLSMAVSFLVLDAGCILDDQRARRSVDRLFEKARRYSACVRERAGRSGKFFHHRRVVIDLSIVLRPAQPFQDSLKLNCLQVRLSPSFDCSPCRRNHFPTSTASFRSCTFWATEKARVDVQVTCAPAGLQLPPVFSASPTDFCPEVTRAEMTPCYLMPSQWEA